MINESDKKKKHSDDMMQIDDIPGKDPKFN
jgi:hypothetical protein